MNIGEADDVCKVLRAVTGKGDPDVDLEPIVERLAQRAGKALNVSPDSILRRPTTRQQVS